MKTYLAGWKRLGAIGLVLLAGIVPSARAVTPAVYTVDSTIDDVNISPGSGTCATVGGFCTLRAAMQAGFNTTIILPAGLYTLTLAGRGEDASATGDLDIPPGASITIVGAGAAATIIDANGLDRAFDVRGGSLTLMDVTVRNGDSGSGVGGAIRAMFAGTGMSSSR
jgi:hypothetical protein